MTASVKDLGRAQDLMVKHLISRIESGEATAAELSVLVKLLKDNNIEATRDSTDMKKAVSLVSTLPFPEYDEHGMPVRNLKVIK